MRKLKVGEFIVQTPEKTAFLTTEKYTDSDPEPVSYIPARPFSEFKAKIKGFWRRIKSWFRSGTKNKKGV